MYSFRLNLSHNKTVKCGFVFISTISGEQLVLLLIWFFFLVKSLLVYILRVFYLEGGPNNNTHLMFEIN